MNFMAHRLSIKGSNCFFFNAGDTCESRGGRPGLPGGP